MTTPQLRVGSGWCTSFNRPWAKKWQYRRLRFAYRAPSFFLSEMATNGLEVSYLQFDEDLDATAVVPGGPRVTPSEWTNRVDILWITPHGEFQAHGYQLDLHSVDVPLDNVNLGYGSGPVVVVLDTCWAVNLAAKGWKQLWSQAVGPNLRLVLGFCTPATVCETTSERGRAFAKRVLGGDRLAKAWLDVATNTSYKGTDRAVAIAFGDSQQDAQQVLNSATLWTLPGPRSGGIPVVEILP
jgi:hypothetical protein